ncbi:MAG TPA: hypothetical protein VMD52_02630 [Patescibacteria group bacterium]|nr:hypothetical protein [Patescibacteria group bacterium]
MRDIKIPGYSIGIFLISLATLVIEISLTRICSVIMWYHFAFMVVSIALLGFAASGAFLTVAPRIRSGDIRKTPALLALFFSAATLIGLLAVNRLSLDPFQILDSPAHIIKLFIFYILFTVPFFFAGLCMVFLFFRMPDKAGSIYFANMLGSGFGCFAAVFLIPVFSNAGAIIAAVFLVLAAAFFFNAHASGRLTVAAALMALLSLLLLANAKSLFTFKIATSKGLALRLQNEPARQRFTSWNAFSQIDVLAPGEFYYAPGLSRLYNPELVPPQMSIYIDADALTPITAFDGTASGIEFLKFIPSSVAYSLRKGSDVCIIGTGGGYDVLTALSVGQARQVAAVEMNPDIVALVKNYFRDFAGHIYSLPQVKVHTAEGRSFIHNSTARYDIIQLSLVDTWAAASTGAYSLAENYLYTTEAFVDYINHLKQNGILTLTRWVLAPPKETLRLAGLALSSLERLGVSRPENNIVMIESEGVGVLLVKREAFEEAEVRQIRRISEAAGFTVMYAPGVFGQNIFYSFFHAADRSAFCREYPFNITPSSDDKPFFFHYYSWKNSNPLAFWRLFSIDRNNISYLILLAAFLQAAVLSALFVLGPLYWARRRHDKAVFRPGPLVYFACLGVAFMFVEVSLIQKFILFLGQPVYSLSVVLFSLLFFAGFGSLLSNRIRRQRLKALGAVIAVLALLVAGYPFILSRLPYLFIGMALGWRFFVCVLLLAPLGLLMGFPFPMGLRAASAADAQLVPWAWGVNGCFSVIGSILSVMLAMSFGFSLVLCSAAFLYLLAGIAIARMQEA